MGRATTSNARGGGDTRVDFVNVDQQMPEAMEVLRRAWRDTGHFDELPQCVVEEDGRFSKCDTQNIGRVLEEDA